MTEAIGIAALERETYEADDIIGSIALQMANLGHPVIIVSGDKDLAQLVDDRIRLYDLAKNVWLDANAVKAKMGVRPPQVPDLLALLGDAVDNIPGIQGVGGKTATLLLSRCDSIEDIPNTSFDDVPIRGREQILRKIRESMEVARTSRELARIRCDIDLGLEVSGLRYRRGHPDTVIGLCKELGLHGILDEIPLRYDQPGLFD
jgi:DNA polymerase-1